ncbi:MAG: hypothetical protein K2M87_07125 [Muribaculaceae bacterium]|nr:hypothetical protein [Muribaculaceae bacterium]
MKRAIYKFLAKCGIFACIGLAGVIAAELYVRFCIPTPHDAKRISVSRFGADTETLLLGHSHFYYGVVSDSLTHTLNMAIPMQNPEYDVRVLSHFVDSLPNLKRVLLSIGWFSFFDPPIEESDAPGAETSYKIHEGIDKYGDFSLQNLELYYRSGFIRKLKRHPQLPSPKGFGPDYKEAATSEALELDAPIAAARHHVMQLGYEDYNRYWTDSLVRLCKSRGWELVFVTTPLSAAYRRCMTTGEVEATKRILGDYKRDYGIEWWDFSEDDRFEDSDFHDSDHLNSAGALKFTRILGGNN